MSSTKKQKTTESYKIVKGSALHSDYGRCCLLVKESLAPNIRERLENSKSNHFEWSITSETIVDPTRIPSALAHTLRQLDGEVPEKESEAELLEWLVQGQPGLSQKRYVLLIFKDGRCGHEHFTFKVPFEVSNDQHYEPFYQAVKQIYNVSEPEGDYFYLVDCQKMDRANFCKTFGSNCKAHVVDETILKQFQEDASEGNPHWAEHNSNYVFDGFDDESY